MNRREFIAISVASSATSAVLGQTLAGPGIAETDSLGGIGLAPPSVARLEQLADQPRMARLVPQSTVVRGANVPLTNSRIRLSALRCLESRMHKKVGIGVEVYHPGSKLFSKLYGAHKHGVGAFPGGIEINSPRNFYGQTVLKITQTTERGSQSKLIALDTTRHGSYLLAIPTSTRAARANWRLTQAELDQRGQVARVLSPIASGSMNCAYMSISVFDQSINSGLGSGQQIRGA